MISGTRAIIKIQNVILVWILEIFSGGFLFILRYDPEVFSNLCLHSDGIEARPVIWLKSSA